MAIKGRWLFIEDLNSVYRENNIEDESQNKSTGKDKNISIPEELNNCSQHLIESMHLTWTKNIYGPRTNISIQ